MAATITLLKNFAGGQGAGFSNYYTYAPDHDANYILIEDRINQLVAESNAVSGPNASLILDLLGTTVVTTGVLGEHSYEVSVGVPTNEVDVAAGAAMTAGGRVGWGSPISIAGSGATGDRWVYIDVNGMPQVSAAPSGGALDIAKLSWVGPSGPFSGPIEQLAEIFFDGDEYFWMRRRAELGDATTPTFEALDDAGSPHRNAFRLVTNRIRDIENLLSGIHAGEEESTTLGAICFGGDTSVVGLALSDGTLYELDSGFYRAAADQVGVAIAGSQLLRFVAGQMLANADGAAATPFFGWGTDAGLGMYRIAGDRLGLASGTILGLELSDYQQLDSPTQFRVRGVRATYSAAVSGTTYSVPFTGADEYDIGAWHNPAGSPGDEEFACPTGGSRLYAITAQGEWAASAVGDRLMEITVNGTTVAALSTAAAAAGTTPQSVAVQLELVGATDIVRLDVTQTSGGALNLTGARLAITALW